MIRIMIVEDDKLARQGLMKVLPWAKHDMIVVADVADGYTALRTLADTAIDLVLSDYSMPGMTGIDLFNQVRVKYPHVRFALITMYETFDIVQQALRLGALDYISKVQLDADNYDNILSNLRQAYEGKRAVQPASQDSDLFAFGDCCYAFFNSGQIEPMDPANVMRQSGYAMQEIGHGIYVCITPKLPTLPQSKETWVVMCITELQNQKKLTLFHLLRRYYRNNLFYNFRSLEMTYFALETEVAGILPVTQAAIKRIEEQWLSFLWLYEAPLFETILGDLLHARLSFSRLLSMLVRLEDAWQRIFCAIFPSVNFALPQTIGSWNDVERLLRDLYMAVQDSTLNNAASKDILHGVTEAIRIIHSELQRPLHVADVAARVNFSRSYFSTSFKRITGLSFNAFLRKERVERAKKYLASTDVPVQIVAEETGYPDEKYFFRVFKNETGIQPGQYRRKYRH